MGSVINLKKKKKTMGDMVKSWRGAEEGERSQWICHCRQNSLTNSVAETPSLNLRLHSLGFLVFIAGMEQRELAEKEQPEYRGREQGATAPESHALGCSGSRELGRGGILLAGMWQELRGRTRWGLCGGTRQVLCGGTRREQCPGSHVLGWSGRHELGHGGIDSMAGPWQEP